MANIPYEYTVLEKIRDAVGTVVKHVTVFEPERGQTPGDYAYVYPEDTDENQISKSPNSFSGYIDVAVAIRFLANDRQQDAARVMWAVSRSNPDCIQNAIYGLDIGDDCVIHGFSWGQEMAPDATYLGGTLRMTILLDNETA